MMPSVSIVKNSMDGRGGLEKWMDRLTTAFAAKGCPVTVLSTNTGHFDSPLIESKRLKVLAPLSFQKISGFDRQSAKYLQKHPTDIVFGLDRCSSQTHHRAGNGVHKAFLERRKLFDSSLKQKSHAINPLHRKILEIEKAAFESPKLQTLFTNSEMVKKEVLHYYNVPEDKITVVHNGVEWKEFEKHFSLWVEKKSKISRAIDLDPALFHFLFIGNGYARKGLDKLLEALAILPTKEFHLSVIGRDKQFDKYMQKTSSLGLSENVSFFGERRDTHNFYQLADCLVIPSYYDPFANVTVEALAMGLSVVSSSYNGGSEVLTPETGIVIPSVNDTEQFADYLRQAMQTPKTWIRSVGIRESVKHLDFPNQLSKIIDETITL
jgi:UDP-glucose:(heptosyl)LPS alpha-1,3-glucosyltransferase